MPPLPGGPAPPGTGRKGAVPLKRFFTKYGLMALATATAVTVILSLVTFFSNNTTLLENLVGTAAAPFQSAAASLVQWVEGNLRFAAEFDALKEENQALRTQIAEMEEKLRQAEVDSEENRRLRRLLELREQRRDLTDLETATVVERSASNWSSAMTLSKGTSSGVEVGDCVITEEGYLAGFISDAGTNWSTLLTLVDTDAAVGAQIFRSGDVAVAQGEFSLMHQGRLKLTYLAAGATLLAGDLVVTSGLGGYCPSGLVIGSVEELVADEGGLTQYAVIKPAAQLEDLVQVAVVKSFEIVE